jgi:hypothetical protein
MISEADNDEEGEEDEDEGFPEHRPGFIGPQLPPIKSVTFWHTSPGSRRMVRDTRLEDRIASIFGLVLIDDPLSKDFITGKESPSAKYGRVIGSAIREGLNEAPPRFRGDYRPISRKKFSLIPSEFLHHAQRNRPESPTATASGFSQWIYSLYGNSFGSDEDRERGLELEADLIERRRAAAGAASNAYLRSVGSDWKLIHSGLHTREQDRIDYFNVPHLRVNGEQLKAAPDLIYRNEKTSEVIIVEIKYSRMEIPTNLWPNIWGQLWCYSQLEIARDAKRVTVVGEVWAERRYRSGKFYLTDLCLRASVRRDPRAPAYDRFFQALFDIYCCK